MVAVLTNMTNSFWLVDYQIGLPDGSVVGANTSVGFLEATGLRSAASTRNTDTDRGGLDGSAPGMSYLTGRRVGVKWLIAAPPGGAEAALQKLTRNWQNVSDPSSVIMTAGAYLTQIAEGGTRPVMALLFKLPDRPDQILALGRPAELSAPVDSKYQFGWLEIQSSWDVPDGFLYDVTVNSATTTLPSSSTGGATFQWAFPLNFGPSTGGTLQAVNNGKYPARPVFKFTGPVKNPKVLNSVTGQYVRVNLSLYTGDVLTVDTASRAVRLNGANRNNALDLGSSLFNIPPGGASLRFASTDSGFVSGAATVYTLNTYTAL